MDEEKGEKVYIKRWGKPGAMERRKGETGQGRERERVLLKILNGVWKVYTGLFPLPPPRFAKTAGKTVPGFFLSHPFLKNVSNETAAITDMPSVGVAFDGTTCRA